MKNLTFLLLLFSLTIFSQNCEYHTNEIDEFNGKSKKYTQFKDLNKYTSGKKDVITMQLRNVNGKKSIYISLNSSLGCAVSYKGKQSFVKIKLEDSTIVTFYHRSQTDCSDFAIFANLTKSDIIKLKKSPIKTIRFNGTKYYHDSKDIVWKTYFIDNLDCIK
jgi:hypothetical protein